MSKQTIEKILREHSRCCNAFNYGPSTLPLVVTSVWWKYTQLGTKFFKGFSGESLSEDVCKHVLGRYIIEFDFLVFYHKWSLTICDGCFDTSKSSKKRS